MNIYYLLLQLKNIFFAGFFSQVILVKTFPEISGTCHRNENIVKQESDGDIDRSWNS